jgi:hypothetical protein
MDDQPGETVRGLNYIPIQVSLIFLAHLFYI